MKSSAILWLLHDMARVMRAERERQQGKVVPLRRHETDRPGPRQQGGAKKRKE